MVVANPEIPPFQASRSYETFDSLLFSNKKTFAFHDSSIRVRVTVVTSDACCPFDMPSPIHVFAIRTHAHGLGKVITAYKFDPMVRTNDIFKK